MARRERLGYRERGAGPMKRASTSCPSTTMPDGSLTTRIIAGRELGLVGVGMVGEVVSERSDDGDYADTVVATLSCIIHRIPH